MNVSINKLAVIMNNVFTGACIVLFEQFICPKVVCIDSQRPLVAVRQQELDRRFIGGFH